MSDESVDAAAAPPDVPITEEGVDDKKKRAQFKRDELLDLTEPIPKAYKPNKDVLDAEPDARTKEIDTLKKDRNAFLDEISQDERNGQWKQRALNRGRAFIKSIMKNEYERIPNSNGMQVLRSVLNLETGEVENVVLRSITIPFWEECIKTVNTPDVWYRVAAIGTPGIGKTTTTSILIRMLLKAGKTVVYLIRTEEKEKWYYEFIPGPNNSIVTNVYPEKIEKERIPSLQDESTYYIVDPGETKSSCNPSCDFPPKVILVSSPDCRHWGESEFGKERGGVEGYFRYLPIWSIEEILAARPILCPFLTDDEVKERYHCFGGIPCHVFGSKASQTNSLEVQNMALSVLSGIDVEKIANGEMDPVHSFAPGDPKSSILVYTLADNDDGTFSRKKVDLASPLVKEKVYSKHGVSVSDHDFPKKRMIGRFLRFA